MNIHERLEAVMRFETPDRPYFFPTIGFWAETIERWRGEGLPKYFFHEAFAFAHFDIDYWIPFPIGDHENPNFFPPMMPKVLSKQGPYEIYRDHAGKTYKRFTDGSSSIPQFLEAPVKTMDDFRKLRPRLRAEHRHDRPRARHADFRGIHGAAAGEHVLRLAQAVVRAPASIRHAQHKGARWAFRPPGEHGLPGRRGTAGISADPEEEINPVKVETDAEFERNA